MYKNTLSRATTPHVSDAHKPGHDLFSRTNNLTIVAPPLVFPPFLRSVTFYASFSSSLNITMTSRKEAQTTQQTKKREKPTFATLRKRYWVAGRPKQTPPATAAIRRLQEEQPTLRAVLGVGKTRCKLRQGLLVFFSSALNH